MYVHVGFTRGYLCNTYVYHITFYISLDLDILDVYAMSESSGGCYVYHTYMYHIYIHTSGLPGAICVILMYTI